MCCLLNKNCDFGVTNNKHTNANLDQWEFSHKVGPFLIKEWKTKIWDNKAPFCDVKNHFVKQFRINFNVIFFFKVSDHQVTSLFLLQNLQFFPKKGLFLPFFAFHCHFWNYCSKALGWKWSTPGKVLSSQLFKCAISQKRTTWKWVTLFKAWTNHWTEVRQVGL